MNPKLNSIVINPTNYKEYMCEIRDHLFTIMREYNWTPYFVAKQSGLSNSTIKSFVRGKNITYPTLFIILKFIKAVNNYFDEL